MYTITFYSFKGGVGRTLALVNVAAQLAKMGRKVLLVDFDLEAPGLETFDRLRPPEYHPDKVTRSKSGKVTLESRQRYTPTQPGVVEYVTEYMRTEIAPDVQRYIYSAGRVGQKGGHLWVMPAGRRDAHYQSALTRIDWLALYREHDGFLLFEDTKAQWEQKFDLDYVLIDSRTGHTDVEGICTRQLPDAVAMLYFPNEQNLVGLREVSRRIKAEETSGLMKPIRLHYVVSNVPDLDDEDRVLRRRLAEFTEEFDNPDAVIHRYESLMLLNQAIFVLDKPKSRLAREYRKLVTSLIIHNPADRDGALRFLTKYHRDLRKNTALGLNVGSFDLNSFGRAILLGSSSIDYGPSGFVDDPLDLIANKFPGDAEIQAHVGICREAKERMRAALHTKTQG